MRVRVYRNLHKHCWSVRACDGPRRGRLIAHRMALVLTECRLIVSAKGRARALRDGRRNVHAYIEGDYDPFVNGYFLQKRGWKCLGSVRYNPFRAATFRLKTKTRTRPIIRANAVSFEYHPDATVCKAYSI
jgi:hypothetical protein